VDSVRRKLLPVPHLSRSGNQGQPEGDVFVVKGSKVVTARGRVVDRA
jgi:hypothetical protein